MSLGLETETKTQLIIKIIKTRIPIIGIREGINTTIGLTAVQEDSLSRYNEKTIFPFTLLLLS